MAGSSDFARIDALLDSALERTPAERTRFIAEACGDDEALREQIERLISLSGDGPGNQALAPGGGLRGPLWDELARELDAPAGPRRGRLEARRVGDFLLGEIIGAGGFADVYLAEQVGLGREAVVKVLRPAEMTHERMQRFLREAQLASRLDHPYAAHIYAFGAEPDGMCWIAMERVRGSTLRSLLKAEGPMALERFAPLLERVCEVVHSAHEQGIVHRDLKPENVMVISRAGRLLPKLLDFGIARTMDAAPVPSSEGAESPQLDVAWLVRTTTRTGTIFGSPPYMAPELWLERREAGPPADQYALAALSYEALSGRMPFAGDSSAEIESAHVRGAAAPLGGEFPSALDAVLRRGFARAPMERYPGILEFAQAFRQASRTAVQSREPDGSGPASRKPEMESGVRRQLTVMSCAFTDVSGPGSSLDPDDFGEVLRQYQSEAQTMVDPLGGTVGQYVADGIVVYFGHPLAYEDAPQRAVQAGLAIIETVRALEGRVRRNHGARIAARVGVHTGVAVLDRVGGADRGEILALGETPRIAARVQELAAPDSVLMTEATERLVRGFFPLAPMGSHSLDGPRPPISVFTVTGPRQHQTRIEVITQAGRLTPFVGRQGALAQLSQQWAEVRRGGSQVSLISGEAGIGKSRLVRQHVAEARHEGAVLLSCQCSPFHQDSAFQPVLDLLVRLIGFESDEPAEKLRKLVSWVQALDVGVPHAEVFIAPWLSLPAPQLPPRMLAPSPARLKEMFLQVLPRALAAQGNGLPVILVVEDLHWMDPSTAELLGRLAREPGFHLILTTRAEADESWARDISLTRIELDRISREHARLLLRHVAGGVQLPEKLETLLLDRTDCIPLFIEEHTLAILESRALVPAGGDDPLEAPDALRAPVTLQGLLLARLDRVADDGRVVAQMAAVLGRVFSRDLLEVVAAMPPALLERGLVRLVEDGLLVVQDGHAVAPTYLFRHALIRDVAYESLTREKRRKLHRRVAEALVMVRLIQDGLVVKDGDVGTPTYLFRDALIRDVAYESFVRETGRKLHHRVAEKLVNRAPGLQTQLEVLAHHCAEAGQYAEAIGYLERAGLAAMAKWALAEATSHFRRALKHLTAVPDGSD